MFKFSKIILTGWDHNISDHGAKGLKRHLITGQIENELYEDRLRKRIENFDIENTPIKGPLYFIVSTKCLLIKVV